MQRGSANGLGPGDYEIKNLIANQAFIESVKALRKEWDIPVDGFIDNHEQNDWHERKRLQLGEFHAAVKRLREDYDLTFRWQTALLFYIPTNDPLSLRAQSPWSLRYTYEGATLNERKNVRDLSSELDEDITQEEVKSLQQTSKHLTNRPKKQLILNADRDNKVYELYQSGKTNPEIAAWLNANYSTSFNTDSVAKIIKRVRERRERGHPNPE